MALQPRPGAAGADAEKVSAAHLARVVGAARGAAGAVLGVAARTAVGRQRGGTCGADSRLASVQASTICTHGARLPRLAQFSGSPSRCRLNIVHLSFASIVAPREE